MPTPSIVTIIIASLALPALSAGGEADGGDRRREPVALDGSLGPFLAPAPPAALGCAATFERRNVAYSWFDTSDGFLWPFMDDDDIDVFTLPFAFDYFGLRTRRIAICDNGWFSFFEPDSEGNPAGDADETHDPLPATDTPDGVIAPFWADFNPQRSNIQRNVELKTFGLEPNRVFVVTWRDFPRYNNDDPPPPDTHYTFQAALYERLNYIRFQYQEIDPSDRTNEGIGLENREGTIGDQYASNQSVNLEGKAIEYRFSMPSLNCTGATVVGCGEDRQFTMTGASTRSQYGCSDGVFLASERVFQLDVANVNRVSIDVEPGTPVQLRAFLMRDCDLCDCVTGDTATLNAALGPGRYYLVVDGPTQSDNTTFTLKIACEELMRGPTGQRMAVADASCPVVADFDRFADGGGMWTVPGWTRLTGDRNYSAMRVGGAGGGQIYTSTPARSLCRPYDQSSSWVNENTDTAVIYWRVPQGEVIQTVYGSSVSGCCGLRVDTTIRNVDPNRFPHYYELRSLYGTDFGPTGPLCSVLDFDGTVEAGPVQVNATQYTVEQDLSCNTSPPPDALCAVRCDQPVELLSAEDLLPKLVVQHVSDSRPVAVQAQIVEYRDVDTICDPDPDQAGDWLNDLSGVQEPISECDMANGLVYAMRVPPGGVTDCTRAGDPCLAPGESYTFTQFFGNGCRLNPTCSGCLATAQLLAGSSKMCTDWSLILDGQRSTITGCTGGGTQRIEWYQDTVLRTDCTGTPFCTANAEPAPTSHTYTLRVHCDPPPQGLDCSSTRTTTIEWLDCSACAITPDVTASATSTCVNSSVTIDASATVVASCPGTLTYQWTRNGEAMPGESSPVLIARESVEGDYDYVLNVSCDPPPIGLACSASTPPVRVTFTPTSGGGGDTPLDLGNTLMATKVLNLPTSIDVALQWENLADPNWEAWEVLRGTAKGELVDPGPPVLATDLLAPPMLIDNASATDGLNVYRVRSINCARQPGPF